MHAAVRPQTKSTPVPEIIIEPSSVVWAKALKIAEKKLSDNNLPFLDPTNLTSQSAGENIRAVVEALDTLQKDEKKKQWSYTWCGKKIMIVEHLAKILKTVAPYSKVVDTAVQSNPQVAALVWAGVWAIMRVCISDHVSTHPETMLIRYRSL